MDLGILRAACTRLGSLLLEITPLLTDLLMHKDAKAQADTLHRDAKQQAEKLHQDAKRTDFDMHYRQLLYDLVSTRRENIRDARDMRNERIQTLLLVATLTWACAFAMLVEGQLPAETHEAWLCLYSTSLGISLTSSLAAMYSMWLLMNRMAKYKIHKPNQNWCNRHQPPYGHYVESFDQFYGCQCRPVEQVGHRTLSIALVATIANGCVLLCLKIQRFTPGALFISIMFCGFGYIYTIYSRFPDSDFDTPGLPKLPPVDEGEFSPAWKDIIDFGDQAAAPEAVQDDSRHFDTGDSDERNLLARLIKQLYKHDQKEQGSLLRTLEWAEALHVRHLLPMATLRICAPLADGALANLELTFAVSALRLSEVLRHAEEVFAAEWVSVQRRRRMERLEYSEQEDEQEEEWKPRCVQPVLLMMGDQTRMKRSVRGRKMSLPHEGFGGWRYLDQELLDQELKSIRASERCGPRGAYPQLFVAFQGLRCTVSRDSRLPPSTLPSDDNAALKRVISCRDCKDHARLYTTPPGSPRRVGNGSSLAFAGSFAEGSMRAPEPRSCSRRQPRPAPPRKATPDLCPPPAPAQSAEPREDGTPTASEPATCAAERRSAAPAAAGPPARPLFPPPPAETPPQLANPVRAPASLLQTPAPRGGLPSSGAATAPSIPLAATGSSDSLAIIDGFPGPDPVLGEYLRRATEGAGQPRRGSQRGGRSRGGSAAGGSAGDLTAPLLQAASVP